MEIQTVILKHSVLQMATVILTGKKIPARTTRCLRYLLTLYRGCLSKQLHVMEMPMEIPMGLLTEIPMGFLMEILMEILMAKPLFIFR
jgi:hypothetical protein